MGRGKVNSPFGWRCLDCRAVWTRKDILAPESVDSCSNCYGERIEAITTLEGLPEELRRDFSRDISTAPRSTRKAAGAAQQSPMGRRSPDAKVQRPRLLQAGPAEDRVEPAVGSHAQAGVTLRLYGPIPSKKNTWKPRCNGIYQDRATKRQIDSLVLQAHSQYIRCGILPRPLEHPDIEVRLFVTSQRRDPDNQFTCLLDVLKAAEVIRNDNARRFNGTKVIHPVVLVDAREEGAEILLRGQS